MPSMKEPLYIRCAGGHVLNASPAQAALLGALVFPSTLERARSILCGLDGRFCLHPFYGVLRGTKRDVFYAAAAALTKQKKIKAVLSTPRQDA